jgi:regulator of PEP synthase PpsR (kinase-PPPase family)
MAKGQGGRPAQSRTSSCISSRMPRANWSRCWRATPSPSSPDSRSGAGCGRWSAASTRFPRSSACSPFAGLRPAQHQPYDVREALEEGCRRLDIPCQFALEPLIGRLAEYSGATVQLHHSSGDAFDEDYYRRVEAMKYTLAHDDGIGSDDLEGADVIIVGVSRATKTPTCMYLASRGIKAANVPLVPGAPPPAGADARNGPLIVGLTVDPVRLAMVRAARLRRCRTTPTDYADSMPCARRCSKHVACSSGAAGRSSTPAIARSSRPRR